MPRCEFDYLTSDHIAEPVNTATGAVYNIVALFIEVNAVAIFPLTPCLSVHSYAREWDAHDLVHMFNSGTISDWE